MFSVVFRSGGRSYFSATGTWRSCPKFPTNCTGMFCSCRKVRSSDSLMVLHRQAGNGAGWGGARQEGKLDGAGIAYVGKGGAG